MPTLNTEELITIIRAALPELVGIYQFGSTVAGQDNQSSDIDIAVLCNTKLEAGSLWELSQSIAAHCGRDIDLVDLRSASTVFRMQVVSKGKRIYPDLKGIKEAECEKFEDFVYSDYARLNEERALILEDIRKRGSVYG